MKIFIASLIIIILVIAFLVYWYRAYFVLFFRKIRKKYLEAKYKPMKKEMAKENLQKARLAYDQHLIARRKYFESFYIKDKIKRDQELRKNKASYDIAVRFLHNCKENSLDRFLNEEERKELEEILSRPIYPLP